MSKKVIKKIGLFGGVFDPIHNGHLYAAQQFHDICSLDEVLFIPTANPPHKKRVWSDPKDRVLMLHLALQDTPYFGISGAEIYTHEATYTINTVREIKALYDEGTEFHYLIGEDNVKEITTWKSWKSLLKECQFWAASRTRRLRGYAICNTNRRVIHALPIWPFNISSTVIRKMISEGRSPRFLMPDSVLEYIEKHRLYRGGKNG